MGIACLQNLQCSRHPPHPSWQTIMPTPYSLTPATSTTSLIFTVTAISTSTDVVPSPLHQPLSVVSIEPNRTSLQSWLPS
ncbi:hypothetical protein P692DRAFT_201088934 [Suillus brevipes Sb2]|nr:hypothetical protein P692DRAFT_201088934 [Suillus brevipes Sb2]